MKPSFKWIITYCKNKYNSTALNGTGFSDSLTIYLICILSENIKNCYNEFYISFYKALIQFYSFLF